MVTRIAWWLPLMLGILCSQEVTGQMTVWVAGVTTPFDTAHGRPSSSGPIGGER
jgi:hypothetical protein